MHSQTKDWFLCFTNAWFRASLGSCFTNTFTVWGKDLLCFTNAWFRASLGSCFLNAFKVWGLYSNMFFTCAWFKVIEFRIMFYKCIQRLRIRFCYVLHMHDSGYEFRIMFYKCIHSLRVRVYQYLLFAFITYWPSDYFWIL